MWDVATNRKVGHRLLIILLIGLPSMDLALFYLLTKNYLNNEEYFFGLVFGQLAFVAVLAGGVGRWWAWSLLLTCLLTTTVFLGMNLWENWNKDYQLLNSCLLIVGCTGPIVFCASLPFLLVRAVTGYRLSSHLEPVHTGRKLNMEDFFITTAVVAAMLVTAPAAVEVTGEGPGRLLPVMAIVGGVISGTSLLVVLPSTVAYFGLKRRLFRLFMLANVCMGVPLLIVYVLMYTGVLHVSGRSIFEEFGPLLVAAAGCLAICLIVLRAAGYRWHRDGKSVETVVDPLAEDVPEVPQYRTFNWNRLAAILIVFASTAQVVFCKRLDQHRTAIESRLNQIDDEWIRQGGYVNHYKYSANGLHAPPNARVEDIEYVLSTKRLTFVELEGPQVTDTVLAKLGGFRFLNSIELRNTNITDESLKLLGRATILRSIGLANTKVTANGLREFLTNRNGGAIDLSELGLTDADIARLPLASFEDINLSHNPITSAALVHLKHCFRLNLNHTAMQGGDFTQFADLDTVFLDYTGIDDQQLRTLLQDSPKLIELSVRGTQITDAVLPSMKKLSYLSLGEGSITPIAFARSGLTPNCKLALNAPKFDGSSLAGQQWSTQHLDLRGSSISDKDIDSLKYMVGLESLNLAGCNVSDASLPFLATLPLRAVDLSNTKVTAAAAWEHFSGITVYISASQCSDGDVERIKRNRQWRLNGRMDKALGKP